MAEVEGHEAFWRRPVFRVTLLSLVLVALLFLFVFPTRTYFAQRRENNAVRTQLNLLHDQNRRLEQEAKRLQSDGEIERIARDRYNLVKPGERAYAIIPGTAPSTGPSTTVPPTTAKPAPTVPPTTAKPAPTPSSSGG